MEAWCAMMATTVDGVRAATEAERRFTIECLHNADPNFDKPKLISILSQKTPEEMYTILASPDVNVTNQRDKDLHLPQVLKTDERVKEMMAASGGGGGGGAALEA